MHLQLAVARLVLVTPQPASNSADPDPYLSSKH